MGQLAYDKGMRILAASQADDVALESEKLKQGLLTYALVHDGLDAAQAVSPGAKGSITIDGWLQYGADRVPKLYKEVLAGHIQTFPTASRSTSIDEDLSGGLSPIRKPGVFQQPTFFNFNKQAADINMAQ